MSRNAPLDRDVVAAFRRNGGKVGGAFDGSDLLLLHHAGAKTGAEYVTPLLYWTLGADAVAVLASNYGAARHPAWFHNLLARPDTIVEIGGETWRVRARAAATDERQRILDHMKRITPGVAAASDRTQRELAVVLLQRI
jgi:deazaflavin-dependent oxidoreductase (nitroreductase family)